jgi:hypothetical protein
VVSTKDPILIVWHAINLLAEVNARLDSPEASERILEAEMVLLKLMRDLWQSAGQTDHPAEEIWYTERVLH